MSSISWLLVCKIILTLVLAGLLQFSKGSSRRRPACNLGWHILCERGFGTGAYQAHQGDINVIKRLERE